MKNVKNAFRIVGLTLLILLALFGVGFIGNFNNRERYMDKRITTEQTDKKNQEAEESSPEKDS